MTTVAPKLEPAPGGRHPATPPPCALRLWPAPAQAVISRGTNLPEPRGRVFHVLPVRPHAECRMVFKSHRLFTEPRTRQLSSRFARPSLIHHLADGHTVWFYALAQFPHPFNYFLMRQPLRCVLLLPLSQFQFFRQRPPGLDEPPQALLQHAPSGLSRLRDAVRYPRFAVQLHRPP